MEVSNLKTKNQTLDVSVEEEEMIMDEETLGSGGELTRQSSFSSITGAGPSSSQKGKRRKRSGEIELDPEETSICPEMTLVRKERENLEAFLFNENNKINKAAIKSILSRWTVLENKVQNLIVENEKLKVQLTCSTEVSSISKSYAQVASSGPSHREFPSVPEKKKKEIKKHEVILVKPENENDTRTNDEIKSNLIEALTKVKSKLKVKSIRQMRKKGLVVEVDSNTDVKLMNQAHLSARGLKIEEPKKLSPCIIIYDVEKDKDVKELKENLISKNLDFYETEYESLQNEIVFRHNFPSKDGKVNWIVQIPARFFQKILKEGRVFMLWRTYRIREFINITRCFKCFGYGHIAKNCNAPNQLCEICGSKEHIKNDCKEKDNPKCINCIRNKRREVNHHLRSRLCPEYERQFEIYKSKIKWS